MLRVNLMIGDREMSAADGRTFERIDPLTGEVATGRRRHHRRRHRGRRRRRARLPGLVGARPERAARHAQGRRRRPRSRAPTISPRR